MKKKTEQPGSEDAELFRQALDGVTPLPPPDRITPTPAPRRASPRRQTTEPEITDNLSDHGAGDEPLTEFLRNGLSRMTLRKLRRGQWPLQDSLDLHGLRSDEARKLLLEFLQQASQRGLRCVCVVHGKGWHTQGGEGVLKVRARHWLTQCPQVLAFCEAPQNQGGGGAVLVLLKAERSMPS
jgi:DNA-nicking Smr family endonuclease